MKAAMESRPSAIILKVWLCKRRTYLHLTRHTLPFVDVTTHK